MTGGILGLRAGWTNQAASTNGKRSAAFEDLRNASFWCRDWAGVMLKFSMRPGLRTFTARSEDLLRLVNDNRVQLFPRGVAELEAEAPVVATTLYPQMLLDPHLLIVYPFAGFLLCGSRESRSGRCDSAGFERVIADGSYQRLVEGADHDALVAALKLLSQTDRVLLQNPEAADVLADVNPRSLDCSLE